MSGYFLRETPAEVHVPMPEKETARRLSTPEQPVELLASIPLSLALRVGGDAGAPVVLAEPTDPAAVAITALAERLATSAPSRIHHSLL